MTVKFLPDVKLKIFDILGLVWESWVNKVQKRTNSLFPGNATSRLHKVLQDYQYWRQKFQIVILKIGYFTEQSIKWHQMLGCDTERLIICKLGHMTSPNLLNDIILSTFRHWPSFKSLRWVGLKTALYKGQTRSSKIWLALCWLLAQTLDV